MAELLGWWTCCCRFNFSRVFSSVWKCWMQWLSWWMYTICAAGLNIECRRHKLLGGLGTCPLGKFVKLDSLKCNFLHSLRWCTNEMWERLIWTDALWSKVWVSCQWTCLVSYGWQGGGKGWGMMNNNFIIHVYDKNYPFFFVFFKCIHYITNWVK